MKAYHEPSFQDRVGRAAEAKKKALDQLRSKPAIDEHDLAERRAAHVAKQAAEEQRRADKKAAEQSAKAGKAAAKQANAVAPPTEAEQKAARDARYAARKARK
jgi:hypothetical protein